MIKKILKNIFSATGIHVIKRRKYNGSTKFTIDGLSYDVATPSANYAPWYGDSAFSNVYNEIKKFTLVDIYRCYELWELTEKVYNLNKNAHIIEIGVWRGGTSAIIGTKLNMLQSNANLYVADTFTGVPKTSGKDAFYKGGEHADTSKEIVVNLLKNKYENIKILEGIFPEDTAHLLPNDLQFGMCHIDVDVYDSAKDICDWIWDKLIIGGVIVFDDYGFHSTGGITKLVNSMKANDNCFVVHNLNGHAVLIKLK
jgi:O-methyltransferase